MLRYSFLLGTIALVLFADAQTKDRNRGQLRPGDRARYQQPDRRGQPGGRPLNPRPGEPQDKNLNSYRCAKSPGEAQRLEGEQCANPDIYCYDAFDTEPGGCDTEKDPKTGILIPSGKRCFPSPKCNFAAETIRNKQRTRSDGKGKEYKCITNLKEITEEDCVWALPCDLGGENPIMQPDQSECRLHKDGSKCQLVDCFDAGLKNETKPETLDEAKDLGWGYFEIIPYYCKHETAPFDCNTAVPCLKDSHNKSNAVLVEKDDSKCAEHHKCVRADECIEVNVSFGDHINVPPGLFHKHQATGHKRVYVKPNRCVPLNNQLDPNDLSRKKELCETEPGCSTDDDCIGDNLKCQIDTCSFYVLHTKKGVPDFDHPYDHSHMAGKFINFTFSKEPHDVMKPKIPT